MLARASIALAVALIFATASGCDRGDPHALAIDATDAASLARWRFRVTDRFTRDEWREFDTAIQEIKLRLMADREASGSDAIDAAMCGRINRRSFRDVLVLGYQAKRWRLKPIRDELKLAIDGNALLVSKPGDDKSSKYLDGLRERQEERLRKIDAELDGAGQRLAELGRPVPAAANGKSDAMREVSAPTLSRKEALAQIADMLRERRSAAMLKYGAWPTKIDRDGSELPEAERVEFLQRRAAAATGHGVIAVQVRDRWWIYDAPAESPMFSRAVTTHLTDADRQEIEETWWTLQAETWARRMASQQK